MASSKQEKSAVRLPPRVVGRRAQGGWGGAPRVALLGLGLLACSSSPSSTDTGQPTAPAPLKPNERAGDIHADDVWKDGYKLTGLIRIFEGATVEIEPGAKISCSDAVQIQVGGTLRIKGGAARTLITCSHWRGILVAANGNLDITGLDTANAEVGIESTNKAGTITINDSTITSTARPFLVREGSTVTATKVTATTPTTLAADEVSVSEVFGTFVAKYLDYSANTNEGVMVQSGGSADISDSTMKASNGFDLISCYGCASLKVSYTTMAGGHCGIHMAVSHDTKQTPPAAATIDHVTSQQNIYGITIYAANQATVTNSNFAGAIDWLDFQGGPWPNVSFSNTYVQGNANQPSGPPTITTPAAAPIPDAKPR
jgi:hypothetical protein